VAVYFDTSKPQALLDKFIARVNQKEVEGKITTWKQHKDKVHFTHTSAEWHEKAFMKPKVERDRLVFNIIQPQGVTVTWIVYAYYHGHLIETFINHFHDNFTEGKATSQGTTGDVLTNK
jgi:hypothetical protein